MSTIMNSFHLSLLLFFSFLLTSYSQNVSNVSSVSYCFPDQSSLLLQLKQEFLINPPHYGFSSKYYQKLESWNESKDCCLWDGVTCEENKGYVIGLDLSEGGINGRPLNPNSTLFNLRHLQKLNLAYNYFLQTSAIPSELRRLTRLTHLNLSYIGFSGEIPPQLSSLTKLVSLDLSGNYDLQFEDLKLETLVKNLTNLRELNLNGVNISSSFPLFITNLTSLESLDLGYCELSGELPESVGFLTKLRRLSLSGNSFSGEIPSSLGTLTQLELIDFGYNNLHGSIPSSLGNLTQLERIDFNSNNLNGSIPSSLGNLTRLKRIDFSSNNLNGSIPYSFANLKHLKMLDLSVNKLVGNIPVGLTNLTLLEYLLLSDNQLTDPIPSFLGSMSNLIDLSLYNNSLTGMIPPSIFMIPSLTTLSLHHNKLSGPLRIQNMSSSNLMYLRLSHNMLNQPIPTSISKLANLTDLNLSYQNITSATDFSIFLKLTNLKRLYFSRNNLVMTDIISNSSLPGPQLVDLSLSSCNISSKFPDFLRTQTQLEELDLSNNNIEGQLPNWLSKIGENTLYFLDISNNKLQGSIPLLPSNIGEFLASRNNFTGTMAASICKLTYLEELDISDNNLDGSISRCWTTTSTYLPAKINLASNRLSGSISELFANISSSRLILISLDLGKNQFVGKIPLSLINCSSLEFLNLESNLINDTFPFFLGNLPNLKVLILRSNRFHGTISRPQNPFAFFSLRIIDISKNDFTGTLPSEFFRSWYSMQEITDREQYISRTINDSNSVNLTNKGIETFYKISYISLIDFSSNSFEGPIPKSISKLKTLNTLNLSSNALTGHIPSSLVNLTQLESLDLSRNRLSGEIPPQLARLTFLSNIRMSDNQLTGHIPDSPQFESQPSSSFQGNLGLCGYPLEKCGYVNAPTTEETDESMSDEEDFNWVAAAIGCIPGLLVGVTIGHILTLWEREWIERILGRGRPTRTTANAMRIRTR